MKVNQLQNYYRKPLFIGILNKRSAFLQIFYLNSLRYKNK